MCACTLVSVCVCMCVCACAVCVSVRVCIRVCVCVSNVLHIRVYDYTTTGGKNLKKFKEWLEPDSVADTKIVEQTWDLLAYLAYDTLQQVSRL